MRENDRLGLRRDAPFNWSSAALVDAGRRLSRQTRGTRDKDHAGSGRGTVGNGNVPRTAFFFLKKRAK